LNEITAHLVSTIKIERTAEPNRKAILVIQQTFSGIGTGLLGIFNLRLGFAPHPEKQKHLLIRDSKVNVSAADDLHGVEPFAQEPDRMSAQGDRWRNIIIQHLAPTL